VQEPFVSDVIKVEVEECVGRISFDRPDQLNAVNDSVRTDFPRAISLLNDHPHVKVVVIRGRGRAFCAGADIKERREPETSIMVRQRMEKSRWMESVEASTKPVIAAVHGACMGGGLELALVCDIRIASPDATFALPEVRLGLIPGGGGTQRIGRLIGMGRALDLILSCEKLSAQRAYDIGLITRMAKSADSLEDEALALAKTLAAMPPLAVACARRAVRQAGDLPLQSGLAMELDLFAQLAPSKDRREAANAFMEKRAPSFEGC
jgi:enoyl-CoA hydratase/carnithine racemase